MRPPNDYEIDKLRHMAEANRAEIAAVKALQAKGERVDPRRVLKLQRSVKAQVRLERELTRRAEKYAPAQVKSGCAVRAAIQEDQPRQSIIDKIAAEAREPDR